MKQVIIKDVNCLNPCFNGRWSARQKTYNNGKSKENVLILVLMEDGMRVKRDQNKFYLISIRLNPCFNGRWSARTPNRVADADALKVLILVLMEDGLRVIKDRH